MGMLGLALGSNPWALAIKAAVIAAVCAVVFGFGYHVKDVVDRAAMEKAQEAQVTALRAMQADYEAQVRKLQIDASTAARAQQDRVAALTSKIGNLKQEIQHAKLDTAKGSDGAVVALDPRPFNSEFIRLFDAATAVANSGPARVPADTAGATEETGTLTALTRQQLLDTHAEAMRICGEWRAQINAIIDWESQHGR